MTIDAPLPIRADLQQQLADHPLYAAIDDLDDLREFMSHHIYAVWDFMGLLKELQQHLAPSGAPWVPDGNARLRRFINEIVLAEESDEAPPADDGSTTYISHFELYAEAMGEVGVDAGGALAFAGRVRREGIDAALATTGELPAAARTFMRRTFEFIDSGKPHVVAAAFAYGREQIIPAMFRALLARVGVGADRAPAFHYYLERHIDLDGDHHGPLAEQMVVDLCRGDALRLREAAAAAEAALEARILFWDGVLEALEMQRERRRTAA